MGKKDRERFGQTGKVFRGGKMVDASKAHEASGADKQRTRRFGMAALQAMSTDKQVKVLRDSLHQGALSPSKLRKALEDNAYKEMRKGANRLRGKGRPVTVNALLDEYRKNRDFKKLAAEVGLDEAWFIAVAKKECLNNARHSKP